MSVEEERVEVAGRRVLIERLIVGALWGAAFLYLDKAPETWWPKSDQIASGAVNLVVLFTPFVFLAAHRALPGRVTALWTILCAAALAGIGAWAGWVETSEFEYLPMAAAALFIAHHLMQPAVRSGRWIAPYPDYFDQAWMHGVRLVLAGLFTGAFFLIIELGGALFSALGLDQVSEALASVWFRTPATALAFTAAIHLTDVNARLTRGARNLGLTLLAWLLPVLVVLAATFLAATAVMGLEALWKAKLGGGALLGAAIALVVLINAAHQDGEAPPNVVLRWAERAAALMLPVFAGLALYAVTLRVQQYGLTPARVVAGTAAVLLVLKGAGYAAAAILPGRMALIERVNVVGAFVTLAVIAAMLTPPADPRVLAVRDQTARLETGRMAVDEFDWAFLERYSGRIGRDALKRLAQAPRGPEAEAIRVTAAQALERAEHRHEKETARRAGENDDDSRVFVQMAGAPGAAPPAGLTEAVMAVGSWTCKDTCSAVLIDLDRDGVEEAVVVGTFESRVFAVDGAGAWRSVGLLSGCRNTLEPAELPKAVVQPKVYDDLRVGGRTVTVVANTSCDE